ncbi:MAG: hypothetical protein NT001_07720 [Candidatus Woesearchaeota archaeon]|nr:hypothetical protein [Candidatus Woesearchaeota archaeon]
MMPMMIGLMGLAILLLAYALSLFGAISQDSWKFDILNFTGALCLAYYTYVAGAIFFSVLLLVWAMMAVINMVKMVVKK